MMAGPRSPGAVAAPRQLSAQRLTARQAAARLGVKIETLYAYVSRGLVVSYNPPGSRLSTFDSIEIERLAARNRRPVRVQGGDSIHTSNLSVVKNDRLLYRGSDAVTLAEMRSFERVCEWLWSSPHSGLEAWTVGRSILEVGLGAQHALPETASLYDRISIMITAIGSVDPARSGTQPAAIAAIGRTIITTLASCLPRLCRFDPLTLETSQAALTIAARLWASLTSRQPSRGALATLNAALVLAADHGLTRSTVAVRTAALRHSDPYASIIAGLGTLSGHIRESGSAEIYDLFSHIRSPDRGELSVRNQLEGKARLIGFGHPQYLTNDVRAEAILRLLRSSDRRDIDPERLEPVEVLRQFGMSRGDLAPNFHFALAALAYANQMVRDAPATIYTIGRIAGWIAHLIEVYRR